MVELEDGSLETMLEEKQYPLLIGAARVGAAVRLWGIQAMGRMRRGYWIGASNLLCENAMNATIENREEG